MTKCDRDGGEGCECDDGESGNRCICDIGSACKIGTAECGNVNNSKVSNQLIPQ